MRVQRIAVFYDGHFFRQGQTYFRYGENRGWLRLPAFHDALAAYIASVAKSPRELTRLVGAHYYDGRMTARAAVGNQLENDRTFELMLMKSGVETHFLPLVENMNAEGSDPAGKFDQKGVDVRLSLDAFDLAHQDRYDVAVLISGDTDFVPLVRKLAAMGKQTPQLQTCSR